MISSPDFSGDAVVENGGLTFHLEHGYRLAGEGGEALKAYGATYPENGSHQVRLATKWTRAGVYYTCLHELQHIELSSENLSYSEEHSKIGIFPRYDSRCDFLLWQSPF